jgi:hypothetical protein
MLVSLIGSCRISAQFVATNFLYLPQSALPSRLLALPAVGYSFKLRLSALLIWEYFRFWFVFGEARWAILLTLVRSTG